jgi:energy-coupling factor transport system substrate-specific component
MVAAGVSAILGSQWGVDTLLSGFVQGAAAELVFAFLLYRVWSFPVLATAAVAAATAAWIHDWVLYYAAVSVELQVARGILMAVSAIVLVAGGSVMLERALRRAGVLEGFRA